MKKYPQGLKNYMEKRILNEDAGTGEVPKGKIEEKKKKIWGQYLDFREKEKEFGASFLVRE